MEQNLEDAETSPLTEGFYVATSQASGVQIGYDWFSVRKAESGLLVESRHTIFGSHQIPVQHARFELDDDWTPRRLEVKAEPSFSTVMEFGEAGLSVSATTAKGLRQQSYPGSRHRTFVMLSGGLYFPLHIVRRFRFDSTEPQQFTVFPDGVAEVRRLEDLSEEDKTFRILEMKLRIGSIEDTLRIVVNHRGDMVRYHAKSQHVLVRLDQRGTH